jgi:hypothetical protein
MPNGAGWPDRFGPIASRLHYLAARFGTAACQFSKLFFLFSIPLPCAPFRLLILTTIITPIGLKSVGSLIRQAEFICRFNGWVLNGMNESKRA